jgi:hypothetical protein
MPRLYFLEIIIKIHRDLPWQKWPLAKKKKHQKKPLNLRAFSIVNFSTRNFKAKP